ncbi:MAG: CopD family protein [Euryarchaeota archaeon]|nr:CopD family protein [Euryarchaeota archaeon]
MNILGIAIDLLHLLATVIWIGGMAFNLLVLRPSLTVIEPSQRIKLVCAVVKRFIYFAWGSIATLVVTGIFMAPRISFSYALLSTTYGFVLVIKHGLVLVMVIIVAVISFVLLPRLMTLPPSVAGTNTSSRTSSHGLPPELVKTLGKIVQFVKLNLALGILVLLVSTILEKVQI